MDKKMECVLLHGWGISNGLLESFADQLSVFKGISVPCLYEIANKTEDKKLESVATILNKRINVDSVVVAWSIGGLIATHMAKTNNKIKAIIFIASTPCFINMEDWPNVIEQKNINNLQKKLLKNTKSTLEYFSGLVAHGDTSEKETNRTIRKYIADINNKDVLFEWLNKMETTDQRSDLTNIKIPIQFILGEYDSLIKSKIKNQLIALNTNIEVKEIKDCGHAPFISEQKETVKIIEEFMSAKLDG